MRHTEEEKHDSEERPNSSLKFQESLKNNPFCQDLNAAEQQLNVDTAARLRKRCRVSNELVLGRLESE